MKKIYLSPERRPPPHGKYWGMEVYERDVCRHIADGLALLLRANGFEAVVAPQELNIYERAEWANANGVDFYLPLHTNASTDGSREGRARGCELLAFTHPASHRACRCIYEELTRLAPSVRGIQNGDAYVENRLTRMVSAYCELGFHDNGEEARWMLKNRQQMAEALCRGICRYYGRLHRQSKG